MVEIIRVCQIWFIEFVLDVSWGGAEYILWCALSRYMLVYININNPSCFNVSLSVLDAVWPLILLNYLLRS